MALRFRKRVRIAPGISVNITQKGITSTTIGPRGLNVNVGKNGKHLNAGLPGTGIYSRTQIGTTKKAKTYPEPQPLLTPPPEKGHPGLKDSVITIALIAIISTVILYFL